MTGGGARARGQPVLLLGAVLCAWAGARVALWDNPLALVDAGRPAAPVVARESSPFVKPGHYQPDRPVAGARQALPASAPLPPAGEVMPGLAPFADSAILPPALLAPPPLLRVEPPAPAVDVPPAPPSLPPPAPLPVRVAVGHNLLLVAGLAQMEVPAALLAYLQPQPTLAAAPARPEPPPAVPAPVRRWSTDGWLMLRQDSASALFSGRPSYGRSQAGAVVRYRLAPASARVPQAYLRGSVALAGQREKELAAGLSLRPLPRVPLRIAAEARVGETDAGTQVRPAVFAVTELPPAALPLGFRGEAYGQAGYVGGRFATAFADGQARVDRQVARIGPVDLRAGAGAWGGAQDGAARLDLGPTAALSFRLGEGQGRLAADYRVRVAGRAEPSSGPSLTLSAGF